MLAFKHRKQKFGIFESNHSNYNPLIMKQLFASLLISFCLFQTSQAQVKFGLRGGLSSADLEPSSFLVVGNNSFNDLKVEVEDAGYGYHLGLFMQAKIGNFFIQPEILYNSMSTDYKITDISFENSVTSIKEEQFNDLDIPVMVGFKWLFLRLGGGPVGHVHLDSTSGLFDIDGYSEDFKSVRFGWQAGIGLDIWKLVIDLKYEGNFNNFGDHITIGGQQFDFDTGDNRMIVSVGLAF